MQPEQNRPPQYPQNPPQPQSGEGQTQYPPSPQANYDNTYNGQAVHNPLETMGEGERIICEIKRHPIGILILYVTIVLLLLLVAVMAYGVMPSVLTGLTKAQAYSYGTIALVVAAVFGTIAAMVGHVVYWGNRWIVTSDSVTQVVQLSLFNTQSSQLSLANVEDVTAEQGGLLPHLLGYGALKAETAGERQKFKLQFCPKPTYYAKLILQAREEFEHENYRIAKLKD